MATRKMSVGQAIIEFLSHQYTVDGDHRERTIAGVFGILAMEMLPVLVKR